MKFLNYIRRTSLPALLGNMLLIYAIYFIMRLLFVACNWNAFSGSLTRTEIPRLLEGGFVYDTAAICYTNLPYLLLLLLPLHIKEGKRWQKILRWIYVVPNALAILINLADTVFFKFRSQRTTMAFFSEFGNDSNLGQIVGIEILHNWYLVVVYILFLFALWKLFVRGPEKVTDKKLYYASQSVLLILTGYCAISGMRGHWLIGNINRPITVNYAFQFTDSPLNAGIVLNTPFTLIRTTGHVTLTPPKVYKTREELETVYNPVHFPKAGVEQKRKNIVMIILESFSREFVGGLNVDTGAAQHKSLTPNLDAMLDSCLYYDEMIANTFFSIDVAPAVLAGIPRAQYPFVNSTYSVNRINSLATELKNWGYTSAYFHGADNESLGIKAFTQHAGVDRYYGLTEYLADSRTGGMKDYDGTWGIWDEEMMQYYCMVLSDLPQPFVAGLFTLTSHHPYNVPERYRDRFVDDGVLPIHKVVSYTDMALGEFFKSARKQPWFENTVFVICADHTSAQRAETIYKKDIGKIRIPILIYDPSGELPRGRQPGIIQHTDIMPTLLGWMGYDRPFVAFGKNVLETNPEDAWAFNWNAVPTLVMGRYFMMTDGEKVSALYDYKADPVQEHNLLNTGLPEQERMERLLMAITQQYVERMQGNELTVK